MSESYDDIAGTKARLPVPAVSVRVFRDRCPDHTFAMDDGEVMDLIEAVAVPIVTQELRRLTREALERNDLSITDLYDRIHDLEEAG